MESCPDQALLQMKTFQDFPTFPTPEAPPAPALSTYPVSITRILFTSDPQKDSSYVKPHLTQSDRPECRLPLFSLWT